MLLMRVSSAWKTAWQRGTLAATMNRQRSDSALFASCLRDTQFVFMVYDVYQCSIWEISLSRTFSPRTARKAELQTRIVQCALLLFREKGVAETTMEAIAEAACVTKRTLYRYFPIKEAIASAYWLDNVRQKAALLPELFRLYPDTRSRLLAVFLDAAAGFKVEPELARMHFSYQLQRIGLEGAGDPPLDFNRFLVALLENGQQVGDVRTDVPADQLAWQVQLSFTGICLMWFAAPDAFPLEERLASAVACFLEGAAAAG